MKERIKAVQRMFWALLAAGAIVALVGLPVGDDADTMDALAELTAFQNKFDRPALERALLARASAQGVVRLEDVARGVTGKGAPKVGAAASAEPVQPSAGVALATLGQINALGRQGSTLEIGTPSSEALALALGWRLSRRPPAPRYELARIVLGDAPCTQEDLARERDVAAARSTMLQSQAELAVAQKRNEEADKLYELRRKWKAPWKAIAKANEKRTETAAALESADKQRKQSEERYEALAKQAEQRTTGARKPGKAAGASACVLALASLRELPTGTQFELALPTPVERRAVPVPPLTNVDFPITRAAGLWDEVADGSVEQAIAQLEQRFTWHYRHVNLGGLKIGGMTVLQLAPLVLLPFFFGVIRRSRGLSALYNPFDRPRVEELPTVGLGAGVINLLVLVVLPLAACVLCAWSLLQIHELPVVPLLCAMGSVGLGLLSHTALNDLLELRDAITRSHSNPPPAPSAT